MGVVPSTALSYPKSSAAAAMIEQAAHPDHSGNSATDQQLQRRGIVEHRIRVWARCPLVRQPLAEKNVQRLEDADQQRNPREFILRKKSLAILFEFVITSVRSSTENRHP